MTEGPFTPSTGCCLSKAFLALLTHSSVVLNSNESVYGYKDALDVRSQFFWFEFYIWDNRKCRYVVAYLEITIWQGNRVFRT